MSNDPQTNILLSEYEATARNLATGVNVSLETMQRYHGLTGQLLASTVRSLWSQQQLEAEIDARVSKRCQECDRTRAAQPMPAQGAAWCDAARAILTQHARLILLCGTAIVVMAIARGQLEQLGRLLSCSARITPLTTVEVNQ